MASAELPPPAPTKNTVDPPPSPAFNLIKADLTLRLLLFAAALVAILAMVTGNQTVLIDTPFSPFPLALDAKFNYSPAFVYFVTAQSVACFYSLLTAAVSALSISKPSPAAKLLLHLAFSDAQPVKDFICFACYIAQASNMNLKRPITSTCQCSVGSVLCLLAGLVYDVSGHSPLPPRHMLMRERERERELVGGFNFNKSLAAQHPIT